VNRFEICSHKRKEAIGTIIIWEKPIERGSRERPKKSAIPPVASQGVVKQKITSILRPIQKLFALVNFSPNEKHLIYF
jgi:hypothetical protein